MCRLYNLYKMWKPDGYPAHVQSARHYLARPAAVLQQLQKRQQTAMGSTVKHTHVDCPALMRDRTLLWRLSWPRSLTDQVFE
jgi:hypothetical protein